MVRKEAKEGSALTDPFLAYDRGIAPSRGATDPLPHTHVQPVTTST
jgi:hypothetical protein